MPMTLCAMCYVLIIMYLRTFIYSSGDVQRYARIRRNFENKISMNRAKTGLKHHHHLPGCILHASQQTYQQS